MATVRVQFELDSDVYPELFEALSALRSTQARNERVRQLATAGLVWENVRIYGAAAIGPTLKAPDLPLPSAALVAQPPVGAGLGERERQAKHQAPQDTEEFRPPPMLAELLEIEAPGADFVDLAINAKCEVLETEAPMGSGDNDDAQISESDVEQVASELPVLLDIVPDEAEVEAGAPETRTPPLYVVTPSEVLPSDAELRQGERSEDAIHLASLAQKPAMRSRLMRMKERGLFKNG